MSCESSEDLQTKSKTALKKILEKCVYLPALEPLLHDAPSNILQHVVAQYRRVSIIEPTLGSIIVLHVRSRYVLTIWNRLNSKVLPNDPAARRLFVTSGGLKKVQEIKTEPDSALAEYIREINTCFPEGRTQFTRNRVQSHFSEIVRYYSPGYSEQLLQRVESYKPSDGCQTISVPDNLCKEGINTSPSQHWTYIQNFIETNIKNYIILFISFALHGLDAVAIESLSRGSLTGLDIFLELCLSFEMLEGFSLRNFIT